MKRKAFTLIELLVVISVMIILMAITIVPIRSMARDNSRKQAVNQTTAMIANARAQAIQQGRTVGFVFFEETAGSGSQTAMQMIVEDKNQQQYAPTLNTVFVALNNSRQYMPRGIRLGVFTDSDSRPIVTGDASAAEVRSRVVLFDHRGQLVLRSGIAAPATAAYADWKLATPADFDTDPVTGESIPSLKGVSSPGFLFYNLNEYKEQNFPDQNAASAWLQQNAELIVINAYTGNIIR